MPDMQAITEQIKTDNEPRLCLCGCGRPVRGNDRRSLYASEACAIKVRNKRWGECYPIATRFCAYAGCECKRHGKSKFCSKNAHHPGKAAWIDFEAGIHARVYNTGTWRQATYLACGGHANFAGRIRRLITTRQIDDSFREARLQPLRQNKVVGNHIVHELRTCRSRIA